ncbi:tRNA-uridine aminocarboxypropyltransferase [Marinimicrobium sp. ARAG 43.8]|uniref:tRNA-uridine aminocarboxypropyltransferase n=1 Tax=Marinimicrobium sp. ARAG 43.8 TaxID=3418719 RepID=UPI003CE89C1C
MSRPLCGDCERPLNACLCQWRRPTTNAAPLVMLQHPDEARHAKNSAILLSLSLTQVTRHIGEQWPDSVLAELLGSDRSSVLLYPETEDLPAPPPLDNVLNADALPQLVVLDATWRKSRKMLYLNPYLQRLPRLSLQQAFASRYRIRRTRKPGQLSTLEASCHALAQLEADRVDYAPLLDAFEGFNEQQLAFRPD